MLDYRQLETRYRFSGILTMETALHVGTGGQVSTVTQSPILRDAAGRPFIPGSSLKGAFRATVARIAASLGLRACDPFGDDDFCISPQNSPREEDYRMIRDYLGRTIPPSDGSPDDERARQALANLNHPEWTDEEITEDHLLILLEEWLCPVCRVFGSPYWAARARFDDLSVVEPWLDVTEIRDGVGIDRDSERAIDGIKFNFEAVPAGTAFRFGLTVENPSDQDLALVAIGLREMTEGMIRLGGIRSRGLGRCKLELDPVQKLDTSDTTALTAYLKGETQGEPIPVETFLADAIDGLSISQEE